MNKFHYPSISFKTEYVLSEAVNAIWVLSFDDEALKAIAETKSSDLLDILNSLKESSIDKLKEAANGTLWNLREETRMPIVNKNQEQGM